MRAKIIMTAFFNGDLMGHEKIYLEKGENDKDAFERCKGMVDILMGKFPYFHQLKETDIITIRAIMRKVPDKKEDLE
jgi:hypothetical protein